MRSFLRVFSSAFGSPACTFPLLAFVPVSSFVVVSLCALSLSLSLSFSLSAFSLSSDLLPGERHEEEEVLMEEKEEAGERGETGGLMSRGSSPRIDKM